MRRKAKKALVRFAPTLLGLQRGEFGVAGKQRALVRLKRPLLLGVRFLANTPRDEFEVTESFASLCSDYSCA